MYVVVLAYSDHGIVMISEGLFHVVAQACAV